MMILFIYYYLTKKLHPLLPTITTTGRRSIWCSLIRHEGGNQHFFFQNGVWNLFLWFCSCIYLVKSFDFQYDVIHIVCTFPLITYTHRYPYSGNIVEVLNGCDAFFKINLWGKKAKYLSICWSTLFANPLFISYIQLNYSNTTWNVISNAKRTFDVFLKVNQSNTQWMKGINNSCLLPATMKARRVLEMHPPSCVDQ